MIHMRRKLFFAIAALFAVTAVACPFSCTGKPADVTGHDSGIGSVQSTGNGNVTTASPVDETTEGAPASTHSPGEEGGASAGKLYIDGTGISEFAIVYADSVIRNSPYLFTEYDFFRLTAEHIASEIERITGCSLDVIPESKGGGEHEILVGPTDSSESAVYKTMDRYEYRNSVSGGKLSVGGGYISTSSTTGLPQPRATFVLR